MGFGAASEVREELISVIMNPRVGFCKKVNREKEIFMDRQDFCPRVSNYTFNICVCDSEARK